MLNSKKLKKKYSLITSIAITVTMIFSGINFSFDKGAFIPNINFEEKVYAATYDPVMDISPISSGMYHSALLTGNGTVKTWGYNAYGQLGLGDTTDRSVPTDIIGLTGVKQLISGSYCTLALMNDGSVKAWGDNSGSQLGLGDANNRTVPTVIPGLTGVSQLSGGAANTLALMNDGTVKAWGNNQFGQIGTGDTTTRTTPTIVSGLTGVKQVVSGGAYFSMVLMNDGTVKVWGFNNYGQLGTGDTTNRSTPTVVPGLTGVQQLVAGYGHVLALMNDGTVKGWGQNLSGQLGQNDTTNRSTPVVISGLSNVKHLTAGWCHSLALMKDGSMIGWGDNTNGGLGVVGSYSQSTPVSIPGLGAVNEVSAGADNTIALMRDGTIKVFGQNRFGALGLGDTTDRTTPTILSGIKLNNKPIVTVSNPTQYYMANKSDNNLIPSISVSDDNNDNLTCKLYVDSESNPRDTKAVTNSISAQTISFSSIALSSLTRGAHTLTFNVFDGTDTIITTITFTIVDFDPTVKIMPIQSGWFHNISLQSDGTVKAWGTNNYGQLGTGDTTNRSTPTVIPGLIGVKQVASSQYQSFALMNDGTVKAWGNNAQGQLGLGDTTQRTTPTLISGLTGVKQLVAGSYSTFALMNDGTVKVWGYNAYGQLGLGNTGTYTTPTVAPSLTGVKQIVSGDAHTLALMNDGTVKAWGYNGYGQLGLGNTATYTTPTLISGLTGVIQVASSQYQSFALMNDGTVKAWGYNGNGQLGLGNTATYSIPTLISGLTGVIQLAAGYTHSMALMNDGTVKAWGSNSYGELGLGDTAQRNIPTMIIGLVGVNQLIAGYQDSTALMKDTTIKIWGYNVSGQLGLGDTTNRLVPTALPGMKFNNKPIGSISVPTQNYISTGLDDSISPSISVADVDNDNLTCICYVDSETIPRDTKAAANTITTQSITFNSFKLGSLAQGSHTLTFNVNDGTDTTTVTTSITINRIGTTLTSNNITNGSVDLSVNDAFPSDTEYQITCGSKYIDSQGNLTAYPTWIKLNNKKITVNGLTSGSSYTFQVTARNLEGNITNLSNSLTITANVATLSSPSNVLATAASDSKIHITWDPVSGADSYIVECDGIQKSASTNLFYDDTSLTSGSNHQYRVCAVKGGVNGNWSEFASTTAKTTLPTLPQNIAITPAGTSITISWDVLTGVSGYDLEVDGTVQANGMKTSFKHTGLKPLTSHTYRVRAKNLGGAGDWSQLQTIMTTGGLPGVISNIKTDISGSSVTLNWDSAVDAETYSVVEVVNGVNSDPVDTTGGTTFNTRGLSYGSTHTYMVQAVNSIGNGAWSSPILVTTYALDAPTNIKTDKTDTSLTLTWNAVNGANSYEVDLKTKDGIGGITLVSDNSGITGTTYTLSGLNPETQYIVNVKTNGNSGSSAWSKDMTVLTPPTKSPVPTNVNAMVTDTSVTIRWDAVIGAVGYDVELDGVVLENDNVLKYVNDTLNPNELHTYRVRARNTAISGEWSVLQSINTLPGKPLVPNGIVVNSTQTGATISWNPVDEATSYDLEINDGTNTYIVSNIMDTSYIHRRVTLNAECRYRIRTNNIEGTSSWSQYIINNAIRSIGKKNSTLDLGLTATDVTDFTPYTMVVTYNPGVINVVDLCTITGKNDLSVGKIDGTDVTIKEFTAGRIVFSVDKVVTPGEAWTGIVNSIKFMAKANGGTTITYTVFYNPQQ